MSTTPVQSALRFPSRKKSLPVQQVGYDRSNLASAQIILKDSQRYGAGMVTWAQRIVAKSKQANRSEP